MRTGNWIPGALLMGLTMLADGVGAPEDLAVQANTDFAFDLYAQLAKENPGENLFFSPYSVSSALAMTAEGARGETALEMGRVLGYPDSVKTGKAAVPWDMKPVHAGMSALDKRFNSEKDPAKVAEIRSEIDALRKQQNQLFGLVDAARKKSDWKQWQDLAAQQEKLTDAIHKLSMLVDQYELNVANSLWAEQSYPFKDEYFETIGKFYKTGGVIPVDFRGSFEKVRVQINSWVEEKTKERIKNVIPPGALNDLTRLVLVNAIYFKGDWSEPFKKENTTDMEFTRADGKKVMKPTMIAKGLKVASYAAFNGDGSPFETPVRIMRGAESNTYPGPEGFAILELPYRGDELSMVLIAPNDPAKLGAVEKRLNSKTVASWTNSLVERDVHVYLPKFKVETTYTLGDADNPGSLQRMGMVRAFVDPRRPEGAVFDGMSQAKSPTEKLYISKVLHKAFVEVNEKGTEAAAATAVLMMQPTSAPVSIPFTPTFKADRPFIYLIRDRVTGSILFVGRMAEP